jgi:hypothetical protein
LLCPDFFVGQSHPKRKGGTCRLCDASTQIPNKIVYSSRRMELVSATATPVPYVRGTSIFACRTSQLLNLLAHVFFSIRHYFRTDGDPCEESLLAGRDTKPRTACALTNHPSIYRPSVLLVIHPYMHLIDLMSKLRVFR